MRPLDPGLLAPASPDCPPTRERPAREATVNDTTATTHAGPLGSTIHVLRADADTVAALAAIERFSRRVHVRALDPAAAPRRRSANAAGCRV